MAQVTGTTNAYDSNSNNMINTQRASGQTNIGDNGPKLAVTTTNINVYANGMRVGFIQSFSPSESRNIIKIQELGTEGVVQSVPSNTNGGQLSVSRFAVYNGNLYNALGLTPTGKFTEKDAQSAGDTNALNSYRTYGNPFKTLKDQRVPLEIQVRTTVPVDIENVKIYRETYVDCWLSSYSKTVAATTITVTESGTIQYSDVVTQIM